MAKTHGYRSILASSTGEVAQILSISGPGVSFNDIDTTTLDSSSNYRTFASGLGDPGEVTFGLVYDPTHASHKMLARAAQNRTQKTWTAYHGSSTGDTDVFEAYVKGLGREIPMDDVISCDVTMHVTGLPGYTT
mgnify:FL=1